MAQAEQGAAVAVVADDGADVKVDGKTRRRLASRARLMAAARKLFVERGFDRTRPQDIAREAKVATGTFYLHFRDKEAAFLAFADQAQDELIAEFSTALEDVHGLAPRLRRLIETLAAYGERNPGVLLAAFLDPVMIAPADADAWRLYDRMGHFLEALLEEDGGAGAEGYNLELVSHGFTGFIRHAAILAGRRELPLDELVENCCRFLERAFTPR